MAQFKKNERDPQDFRRIDYWNELSKVFSQVVAVADEMTKCVDALIKTHEEDGIGIDDLNQLTDTNERLRESVAALLSFGQQ